MSEECIHGFENGMCAICNPKPEPEAPAKAPARARATTTPRQSSGGSRPALRSPAAPLPSVLDQRVFHVTSIRNLPGILRDGALLPTAEPVLGLSPVVQREERSDVLVDGTRSTTLERYIPFFLSPDATLWHSVRAGARHPRVSSEALASGSAEFVILVSTIRALRDASTDAVLADGDPASDRSRLATTSDEIDRMIGRLRAQESDGLLDAELLVADAVPLDVFSLVGVQNDKVRANVRELLAGSGFAPKISVYPPWFQPVSE